MANKHLNIVDLGTTGSGWQTATPISDTHIAIIKDRSAKTSNSLNAIPSPFSRLHVFETAFKLVTEDIREQADRTATVYRELVSDCLDALELLFNKKYHESQGDIIEIVKWKREQHLDDLKNSEFRAQKIFAKTLDMYLSQDFDDDFDEICMIKYDGMVLAGTSPFSLVFTNPGLDKKDGEFRSARLKNNFKLINPNSGVRYFSRNIPFDKRIPKFRKYLFDLFDENSRLQSSAVAVWNYLNEFEKPSKNQKKSATESIRTPDAGQLTILNVPLKQNNDDSAVDIFNDHIIKVPYKINKEKFYTPTYLNDKDQLEKDDEKREFDFLLPIKSEFLAKISLQDIPRLITYKAIGDRGLKVVVKNPHDEKAPWEKKYFVNHKDKRDGEIVDYLETHNLKFTLGIFPFLKVSQNNAYNDFYKVILGMGADNAFLSNKNFDLSFLTIDQTEGKIDEIREDDTKVNVKRYDRTKFEDSNNLSSIYYQINNSCFDAIQIKMPFCADVQTPSGLIVPSWNTKEIKAKRFDFSIDFGTTNTFIAYTVYADNQKDTKMPRPKAFDITKADMQMVMLNRPIEQRHSSVSHTFKGGKITEIITEIFQHEFIPSVILNEEDDVFSVPFRTAVFEKQNLSEVEYSLLDNINVHFAYQRAAMMMSANTTESQKFEPNLKWKISNDRISKIRVDLFLEQILRMIRYKVLLNGGDPALTNITWFIPLSLTPGAIRNYEQLWQKHFTQTLKSNGKLTKVSESEAPYYYLDIDDKIRDRKSVLNIDIGGGSTDVMLFADQKPLIGTSFNFAGNVFWGNGYSAFIDGNDNGIFKDLNEVIYNRIKPTHLKSIHEELVKKSSTEEIINFWIANDNKTQVLKELNSEKYRISYLLHYTSILFHCAQFVKSNQQTSPTCIIFSGNGSKYIDFIHDEVILSKIAGFIFRKVIDTTAKNPQIILPKADRKESTCYGGLYKNNNIVPDTKTYLGTTLDFEGLHKIKTYQDLFNNPSVNNDVEKNVSEFINTLIELNNEINFKAYFTVDFKVELLGKYLLSNLSENLAAGYSQRKKKVSVDDEISDSLFFYPIIGFIHQLTQLTKENLDDFEPKQYLYSDCPDGNGYFLAHRLQTEKKYDAIFKVIISESNTHEAQFTIIDETPVFRRAIGSIEQILAPVCEYSEFPSNKDQAIQIISPGKLIRKDDEWQVERKLEIKFL